MTQEEPDAYDIKVSLQDLKRIAAFRKDLRDPLVITLERYSAIQESQSPPTREEGHLHDASGKVVGKTSVFLWRKNERDYPNLSLYLEISGVQLAMSSYSVDIRAFPSSLTDAVLAMR